MEKLKAMIRKMVQEEGFSRGSRKDKEAAKSRSTVLGMIQVEEEEAPSFDMSKTSDRGDGNYVSGNLKESTIKNIIRQAIIEEAKNWPLVEVGRTAGTETSQATPPKTSAEKQAVKLYGAYIEYKMNSGNSEYGYADQRNQLALKMLKDKFKVPSNLKSKLKDKKYHDKFTDYKSIVWEGKITEGWKPIAKKNVKYKDKWGTWNWEIESGIDTDVMGGNTPKIILFYKLVEEDGFPSSGGNTFWLKHKDGTPYTPKEAKALVSKISNKKIHDFQRKSTNPSGTGQNIYYVDGKFIREGKLTEGMSRSQAQELLNQLGGNRFKAMVGAKDFGIGSTGLHFKIGRNSKSISHIAIRLTSMDVYEMKFLRVRAGNVKVVKKVNNVYADQLGVIFKKYTGMNVRL